MNNSSYFRRTVASVTPALAAVGLLLASGPGFAQSNSSSDEITVVAPHMRVHNDVDRDSSGMPVDRISVSHRVGYSDLNLRQAADVQVLQSRVRSAAVRGCSEIDQRYPEEMYPSASSSDDCVATAISDSMPQVNAAIASASGD